LQFSSNKEPSINNSDPISNYDIDQNIRKIRDIEEQIPFHHQADDPDIELRRVMNLNTSICPPEDFIPNNATKALNSPNGNKWREAMNQELESLQKHQVCSDFMSVPQGKRIVGRRWVFAIKRNDEEKYFDAKLASWRKASHKSLV